MAAGETLLHEWPTPDFVQEISVSEVSPSSPVALQQGLKTDFGCTFISVSSGSLEQALSRNTHRCSWLGTAAQNKQLHLAHKATKGREETSSLSYRHVAASGEHEGGLQWFESHTPWVGLGRCGK